MIRILLVDDQTLLREGLQSLLQAEKDFEIVGSCENGMEALRLAEERNPDVVLMDIKMPIMDGIEAMRRIKRKRPATSVLMLSSFGEDRHIVEAMAGGADGYLLKDMPSGLIVRTIREARDGGVLLPAPIASKIAARLSEMDDGSADAFDREKMNRAGYSFTSRERQVILLLVEGFTNRQIASSLYISEGTVRNYVSSIYGKLGAGDRESAVPMLRSLLLDD